jgi:hypothetical protein
MTAGADMTDALAPQLVPLEQVISYAPLGIRFWDAAAGRAVGDGLVVRARRAATTGPVALARTSRSGISAFVSLPGLRFLEHPTESVAAEASPPPVEPYAVDVADPLGRFVPVAFRVDAPHAGVFRSANGSPPDAGPPGFFLFPAVARPVPAALGAVRAELHDRSADQPAAHAVVQLNLPGNQRAYGLADGAGRVVVMYAHPRFAPTVLSPPPSAQAAREQPAWPATVRVLYDRAAQVLLAPDLPPDLASLFGQAAAPIWSAPGGPSDTELGVTLVLGQEAVLRTDGEPRLLIG